MENVVKRKILPITMPTITAYPGRAHLCAILEGNNRYTPWLMENYIQTESLYREIDNDVIFNVDFFNMPRFQYSSHTSLTVQSIFCPCISLYAIENSFILNFSKSYLEWMINVLSKNYYVTTTINEKYINAYGQQKNDLHNILIYGYDIEKKIFNIADFFSSRRYQFKQCTFEEFNQAIKKVKDFKEDLTTTTWEDIKTTTYFKIDESYHPDFHLDLFIAQIKDYLGNTNICKNVFVETNNWNIEEARYRKFGNLHFDNLKKYIGRCCEKNIVPNVMPIHIIYEHKLSISQRINFLLDNGYINNNDTWEMYQKVVKNCLLIRNKILRSHVTGKCPDATEIYNLAFEAKKIEEYVLNKLVCSAILN